MVIISIWVIIAFLLLPAGSFRYWTAAFIAVLLVVGVGDYLPVRTLLTALLALHVVFVVPAAARSNQRRHLAMGLVSAVLLAWLVIAGGIRYWLPALIVAVLVVPFGVPLLWRRARRTGFEVRIWPQRRAPGDPRPPLSAQRPAGTTPPADSSAHRPAGAAPSGDGPGGGAPASESPSSGKVRRPHRPVLPAQGGSRRSRQPGAEENQPPAIDEPRAGENHATGGAGAEPPPTAGDNQPPGPLPPPTARNTGSFPPGQRPDRRPAAQPRPPRRRKPPASS